jgi:hypothetical protein
VAHLRSWLCFFVCLWWLWILLVGEWNHFEWIGATAAAAVAATLGEVARTAAGAHARIPAPWLLRGWSAFPVVFSDFATVLWALFTGRRGSFVRHAAPAVGDDPEAVGIRVWTNLLADYSPNAYVIALEEGEAFLHDLVPRRQSEKPA